MQYRAQTGQFPTSTKHVFLFIGTNNVTTRASHLEIAEGILTCALEIKRRLPSARVVVMGLLPRQMNTDRLYVVRKVSHINMCLRKSTSEHSIEYINTTPSFEGQGSVINRDYYYRDGLHLNDTGNGILCDLILEHIKSIGKPLPRPSLLIDDFVIGQPEVLGRRRDGPAAACDALATPVALATAVERDNCASVDFPPLPLSSGLVVYASPSWGTAQAPCLLSLSAFLLLGTVASCLFKLRQYQNKATREF